MFGEPQCAVVLETAALPVHPGLRAPPEEVVTTTDGPRADYLTQGCQFCTEDLGRHEGLIAGVKAVFTSLISDAAYYVRDVFMPRVVAAVKWSPGTTLPVHR